MNNNFLIQQFQKILMNGKGNPNLIYQQLQKMGPNANVLFNQLMQNPQIKQAYNNAFNQAKQNGIKTNEDFARQLAKQNNIDISSFIGNKSNNTRY